MAMSKDMARALLDWYKENQRDLPWRRTRDPYRIWISEIMLQQTRVEAVKPYYARFLNAFPTALALANADDDTLMKCWEGLGYYSRARNLKRAARQIMERHGGEMPRDYDSLLALSGIGEYTAGAIASIAFGIPTPAVDGNVLRVLSRLNGCADDISLPATKRMWQQALIPVIPKEDAGSFTQALIEVGATVCAPNREALCSACPLREGCVAHREGLQGELPVKASKKPRRIEQRTVLILGDGERIALRKRPNKGLLAGLYELPSFDGHLSEDALAGKLREMGVEPQRIQPIEDSKHIFSHVEWHMIAYWVLILPEDLASSGLQPIEKGEQARRYALPSAFAAYLSYL